MYYIQYWNVAFMAYVSELDARSGEKKAVACRSSDNDVLGHKM